MIIGYNENNEPMFDTAKEYIDYLNDKKQKEHDARTVLSVSRNIDDIIYKIGSVQKRLTFGGLRICELSELRKLKNELNKEFDILEDIVDREGCI